MTNKETIRIAILDMYEGTANEGMRCIREIIETFASENQCQIAYEIFDVRGKAEVPDIQFDAYISSGGPGDPIETEGSEWEARYFDLLESIKKYNREHTGNPKHVFLICHSFQLYCRHYGYGQVSKRKSTSFGVMTCHKTNTGKSEPFLGPLRDPFWVVDSRDYQLIQPDLKKIAEDGGSVLCIEKYRPHIKLERAVMAIRFDEAFFGTQFHPEADAAGMRKYLLRDDKKKLVINRYGEKKYHNMLDHLNDPDKIMYTHNAILPRFLTRVLGHKLTHVPS